MINVNNLVTLNKIIITVGVEVTLCILFQQKMYSQRQ